MRCRAFLSERDGPTAAYLKSRHFVNLPVVFTSVLYVVWHEKVCQAGRTQQLNDGADGETTDGDSRNVRRSIIGKVKVSLVSNMLPNQFGCCTMCMLLKSVCEVSYPCDALRSHSVLKQSGAWCCSQR